MDKGRIRKSERIQKNYMKKMWDSTNSLRNLHFETSSDCNQSWKISNDNFLLNLDNEE